MEREFGKSEHIFRHKDFHWGPGNSADTWRGREGILERREEGAAALTGRQTCQHCDDAATVQRVRETGQPGQCDIHSGVGQVLAFDMFRVRGDLMPVGWWFSDGSVFRERLCGG